MTVVSSPNLGYILLSTPRDSDSRYILEGRQPRALSGGRCLRAHARLLSDCCMLSGDFVLFIGYCLAVKSNGCYSYRL